MVHYKMKHQDNLGREKHVTIQFKVVNILHTHTHTRTHARTHARATRTQAHTTPPKQRQGERILISLTDEIGF